MQNTNFRLTVVLMLVSNFIFIGCGGTLANPVDRYQPRDGKKSCNALLAEISAVESTILQKNQRIKKRDTDNAIWFITGWFLIVPWFFIDSKGSFEIEKDALSERKTNLKIIYADKCNLPSQEDIDNLKK